MQLYHNNMPVCAQKVRLVLHEKQLPVTEHHLDLRGGDQLNPKGVVPVPADQAHGRDQYSLADVAMLPYVCRLEDLQQDWLWAGSRSAIADWL